MSTYLTRKVSKLEHFVSQNFRLRLKKFNHSLFNFDSAHQNDSAFKAPFKVSEHPA